MIRRLKHLSGFTIAAADGTLGKVKNAFFDDSEWAVRYLVVDTGAWLTRHRVLISPLFVSTVDGDSQEVRVTLTREQVENSPDIDFDQPVSRQQEADYYRHYRSFGYWGGPFIWGPLPFPTAEMTAADLPADVYDRVHRGQRQVADSHLRSADEVAGYHIQALDGTIGHVEDFLFDDETWLIEFLVADTRDWLPGRHVMIPPAWVESVDWSDLVVEVGQNRESIRQRPEYREALMDLTPGVGMRDDPASATERHRSPP